MEASDQYMRTIEVLVRRVENDPLIKDLAKEECYVEVFCKILNEKNNSCSSLVKEHAMHVFNNWIDFWWNKSTEDTKISIKKLSLDLLNSPLSLSDREPMRQRIAIVISNVAARIYPEVWPSFITEMTALWESSSFGRQDVIIKSLEILVNSCSTSSLRSISSGLRKPDTIRLLCAISYSYLKYCIDEYQKLYTLIGKLGVDP
jgi:hypothetical protein